MQNECMQIKTASTQTFLLPLWPLENVTWQEKDFSQSPKKKTCPHKAVNVFAPLDPEGGFFPMLYSATWILGMNSEILSYNSKEQISYILLTASHIGGYLL